MTELGLQDSRMGDAGIGDYFALLKPRVMSLVVFTAIAGLLVAPVHVNPFIGFVAILCIAVGAGATNRPAMAVNTTSDMTRGLSNAK